MSRVLDIVYAIYFTIHIPLTIVFNSQILLRESLFLPVMKDMLHKYAERMRDDLVLYPQKWMQGLVACELLFQLPYFFVAVYAFFRGFQKCPWISTPTIIYSTHVLTSIVPILSHFIFSDFSNTEQIAPRNFEERCRLISIYLPFIVIPSTMILDMLFYRSRRPISSKKSKSS